MDSPPPPHTSPPASGGKEGLPLNLTPSMMQGLLAAGAQTHHPVRRAWEPPGVEVLQRLLPQYAVISFLARGGMGAVYKGVQKTLQRPVAIKVLPPEADSGDMNYAERFKREAQAMARLSHPNIVAVYDGGEVVLKDEGSRMRDQGSSGGRALIPHPSSLIARTGGSLLYFVMEYVEGTDVQKLIASEGKVDARRAVGITTAVCDALAFAHEEGIIHRDIKPSNIMIDRKGRVKVADFGLAKSVNADGALITRSDVALGSPDFVSPEALLGGLALDQRADIYAVGVMLYQLLTGDVPRGNYDPPSQIVPGLDRSFDAIVTKALQTDREKRYCTATELKRDLETAAQKLSQSKGADVEKTAAGKRAGALLIAVAAALLGIGASAYVFRELGRPKPKVEIVKPLAFSLESVRVVPTGPSSASTSPSARHWRPITFRQDEILGDGGATVMPDGSLKLSRGVEFNEVVPCQDVAVKARLKRARGTDISGIRARIKGTPQVSLYYGATRAWMSTESVVPPQTPVTALKLPQGSSKPLELLLVVIGQRAYGSVDGVPLPPLELQSAPYKGSAGLWSMNGEFSDVQFLRLDGLSESEALKLSGTPSSDQ